MSNMDDPNAPVFDHEHKQPYAKRTVRYIFFIVFLFIATGVFAVWYFGDPYDTQDGRNNTRTADNPYNEDTGRGTVYAFFRNIFEGTGDGVKRSNLNLPGNQTRQTIEAIATLHDNADKIANQDDGYNYSLADVAGRYVMDSTGQRLGHIEDIIVNQETGEAKAVIVNESGLSNYQDLNKLSYSDILQTDHEGNILASINTFAGKEFDYNDLEEGFISLRFLRFGQVLDDNGQTAGNIRAIIYENAEARKIFFGLDRALASGDKILEFGIPFEDVEIVRSADGYDVQLTEEQTRMLARSVLEEASQ